MYRGKENMSHTPLFPKAASIATVLVLACLVLSIAGNAAGQGTTLKIEITKGIKLWVTATITNIGNETATNLSSTISIQGGILHRINVTSTCHGGCGCNTTLNPNKSVERSTRILGFGPIDITASAQAANAQKVEATATGFALGPLVVIK